MAEDALPKIVPLGDSAILIEFGNVISTEINAKAIAVAGYLQKQPFPGFIEAVPAYASVAVMFDPIATTNSSAADSAYTIASNAAVAAIGALSDIGETRGREIVIEGRFGGEFGPDLISVAQFGGLTEVDAVELFVGTTYRVFMLGFLPGFAYMGTVNERIAVPRHETPRGRVAKGSIGIAGEQAGIYSLESPGGWQIIGRTDTEMFTPFEEPPSYLRPGDSVRFAAI